MTRKIYSHTQALCPICKGKVQARIVGEHDQVHMEKFCPDHGFSQVLLSSEEAWYAESLHYVKPKQNPLATPVTEFKGCPESCGTCPEHAQHTCLPVIEINTACNMECPVCLKGEPTGTQMSREQFHEVVANLLRCEGTVSVINLSGGEPTLHPDLIPMIEDAKKMGVTQVTVSTNGLRLLRDSQLRDDFRRTGTIVALQFDGFEAITWETLRGRDLRADKQALIQIMEQEGVLYSLVATVAQGVNDHEIPSIVDFFFRSQALTLMFQPVALSGYAARPEFQGQARRITTPDVIRGIGESSFAERTDFTPLPCSHYSCFALSYYLDSGDGKWMSLKDFLGKERFLDIVANRTLPGLDSGGHAILKERLYELWSAADSNDNSLAVMQRLKTVIRNMERCAGCSSDLLQLGMQAMKAIFIHQFMDVETMDLGRLMKCCNPYPRANGKLIPMCAANVFGG